MFPVESAKIFGEITVTTTEWMDTSVPTNRSDTEVAKKQKSTERTDRNRLSIKDLETPKELNETNTEVPHLILPFSYDTIEDHAIIIYVTY